MNGGWARHGVRQERGARVGGRRVAEPHGRRSAADECGEFKWIELGKCGISVSSGGWERRKGEEGGEIVAKALHGQRYLMPLS